MNSKSKLLVTNLVNKFYWRQHPEAALRYLPIVSRLKKDKLENSKILEIGSGSLGIIPYIRRKIDGIDVDFTGPKTDLLNAIYGNAWDLPFTKNAYEVTLSVDVLEHLGKNKREKAVYEMLRVAKKLAIIVVPTGVDSQNQDRQLQAHWNKIFKQKNQFLEEHVEHGLPTVEEVLVDISKSLHKLKKRAKVKSYPNLNLQIRKLMMLSWITKNRFLYYFYMKGLLPFVPIIRHLNFGKTYRHIFVIEFTS